MGVPSTTWYGFTIPLPRSKQGQHIFWLRSTSFIANSTLLFTFRFNFSAASLNPRVVALITLYLQALFTRFHNKTRLAALPRFGTLGLVAEALATVAIYFDV
jgi:hypothetical protein